MKMEEEEEEDVYLKRVEHQFYVHFDKFSNISHLGQPDEAHVVHCEQRNKNQRGFRQTPTEMDII